MAIEAVPPGLNSAGSDFWRSVLEKYNLEAKDVPVLTECCAALDEIELLKGVLRDIGPMTVGSQGQPVLNPAISSLRDHRVVLGKLLQRLALPDEVTGVKPAERRGQAGAAARWAGHVAVRRPGA